MNVWLRRYWWRISLVANLLLTALMLGTLWLMVAWTSGVVQLAACGISAALTGLLLFILPLMATEVWRDEFGWYRRPRELRPLGAWPV